MQEDKIRELIAFAKANDCDAVLLDDGTIEKYRCQILRAAVIYKVGIKKIVKLGGVCDEHK